MRFEFADNKNSSSQGNFKTQKNNQQTIKKANQKPDKKNRKNKAESDNKIHYVLPPKKILEKRKEIKDLERSEKQKTFQKQSKLKWL